MLITADFHLTDRPIDEYRWTIFPWLRRHIEARNVNDIFILGDLTHQKNNHSAALVNRLVEALADLTKHVSMVWLLKGNHDYDDPEAPFFGFLERINRVSFISGPMEVRGPGHTTMMLPHARKPMRAWEKIEWPRYDRVFMHQPIVGAKTDSGYVIEEGLPSSFFKDRTDALVLSGDVHVPQKVAGVIYVGAPHPINFGDEFQPRVLHLDKEGGLKSINRSVVKKVVVTVTEMSDLDEAELSEGDMVRIVVKLPRSEFATWDSLRKEIVDYLNEREVVLCGLELRERKRRVRIGEMEEAEEALESFDPVEVVTRYCEQQELDDDLLEAGLVFVKGL